MSNGNYNSGTGGWEWNFYNEQSDAVVAENNYWGTTTSAVIAAGIKQNTGSVDYDPFLTEPAPCAPGPEPAPAPPNITSFAPPSPVNDTVCNWRTVNVTVNQTVNVSWYLNNTLQHTNVSTKEANYTLHAEVVGEHNVSAIASNANGTDMQTWVWNVIAPGISVEKTANLTEGAPCTNVAFTINVTNTGDCTLNPVKVVDTLPTGMSYVSSSPAADTHDGTVTWNNVGPLAAFTGSKTLYLVAHIDSDATGILNNTVIAMGTPPEGDNVTDKGFAEVTTLNPAISVTKTASPSSGAASTNVNFTIVVSNTCDCALNPVKVVDTLPTGMSYVSSSPAADTHDGTITWDLGSMASGASTTIHLTAHIDEGASGTLTDSVTATGTPPHGDDVSATDTADVTVLAPGISVNKVANPPDVAPSSNVEFTITVSNIGDCTLDPVRVVDTLLGWMSYVSSSPAADTHDGTIIWNNVGPLDPGDSKTITLVARIASDASGSVTNAVMVTGTNLTTGVNVTDSDTVTVTVLAKTIEPSTKTLIDVTTEIKSDGLVIEGEQFGWMTGNGNLLNNPPISPGEAVGSIKYDEKMIGSNGTTEFTKNFGVNTNVTPNIAVTKDIGYKSGDLGSLSHAEQAGMRYSGASPPLSSTTKCEDVNAYSKMVVTDAQATTETEVGITETDERDLHYGIDAEGKGSVSAGVDASASSMSYKDKSTAYGGNFSLHKKVDYTSKPSTSITTDLKGDRTVVEEGQFGSGNGNLKYDEKMIGSNGTTEFEKYVDASTSNLAVDKSIGYKSGDLGSLSHSEQVGMRYSSNTKCEDVNAYGKMVVTTATAETEVEITEGSLYYGIDAEGKGSVSAGADAFVADGRTDMAYKDKSNAYGNFTFEKKVGYNKPP